MTRLERFKKCAAVAVVFGASIQVCKLSDTDLERLFAAIPKAGEK